MEVLPDGRDRLLLATLCAALPSLRERAEAGLWSDELDEMVGELAAGTPVVEVCRRLGLLTEEEGRRGPAGTSEPWTAPGAPGVENAHLAGLAEVILDGDYRCPQKRCVRRGHRDDRGRVPVCSLTAAPMTFRSGT